MSDIALVTVNYNNAECTRGMLESLLDSARGHLCEVIIVDNASKPEDFERIHAWVQSHRNLGFSLKLVRNKKNLGYFAGLNIGLDKLDNQHDKVIVCNNDVLFPDNFFNRLSELDLDDDVFVVAPDVVTLDGVHQNPHSVHRLSWARKLSYAIYFSNYWIGAALLHLKRLFSGPRENLVVESCDIYMGIGACYVLTAKFFRNCGRLDDRVFLWGEEPLLANQVREAGGRTRYVPQLVVKHLERRSTGGVPRWTQYRAARKSYKLYRRYL